MRYCLIAGHGSVIPKDRTEKSMKLKRLLRRLQLNMERMCS